MLDNRELAALIWLVLGFSWVLTRRGLRSQIRGILRSLLKPVIFVPLLCLSAYIGFEVWTGSQVGLWTSDLTKDTLIWSAGTGAILFFNAATAGGEPDFFRRTLAGAIGVTVFLEFFMNLFVMSLPAELVLQPTAAAIAVLATVAGTRDEQYQARLLNGLLAILGFSLLAFTAWQLYRNWNQIDHGQLLHEFLLPVWLTIGLIPFLYFWRLYVAYDSAWRGINWATSDVPTRWRARTALITSFHLRYRDLEGFSRNWCRRLAEASSYAAACQVIGEFLQEKEEDAQAAAAERERLERYAGVEGTDADGRRLDRRAFKETKEALRWIHTCQMGWYERRGGRYRDDLLDIMGDSLIRHGLPEDHGITLKVSVDGQAWIAWRRTVTGWCFAIGAAAPPPDEWTFDGPEPPDGFPGEDPAWGDTPYSDSSDRNWW